MAPATQSLEGLQIRIVGLEPRAGCADALKQLHALVVVLFAAQHDVEYVSKADVRRVSGCGRPIWTLEGAGAAALGRAPPAVMHTSEICTGHTSPSRGGFPRRCPRTLPLFTGRQADVHLRHSLLHIADFPKDP
jgi:hypothetical protein